MDAGARVGHLDPVTKNSASPPGDGRLPIEDVLSDVIASLAATTRLIIAAPPGAGKTTGVPLALLPAPWAAGRILLLEPRRIAARLAAERMATKLGERVGETVGLSTRIDRRVSARTRIEVVTDGLFTRRITNDPELSGVAAVLFDEFHERSLNLDLGLALARETQAALRPDLRLVVMSATLDVARVAAAFDAPAIESEGRAHPVETRYLGRDDRPLDEQAAAAIRRALREEAGSVLAFLPGRGEIERTIARLTDAGPDVDVAPLYGALPPREQDAAVAPAQTGRRKVVVATDIAESSLTIVGVRIVVDAGLARVARHDPASGETRLATERASLASVDQRRGRAGRTAPGVCYRMWREPETRGLAPAPTPEIASGDLSGLVLALAEWGERDPARLPFIDQPPAGRLTAAVADLKFLGALDGSGAITETGRRMASLPMAPRLAAMIIRAGGAIGSADQSDHGHQAGAASALAARIALLVGEPGLGGRSTDLRDRLAGLARDRSPRARTLLTQAVRWAGSDAAPAPAADAGRIVAAGDPSRIARRVDRAEGKYLLASGREARLDPGDPLGSEEWLAVADATGLAARARILAAAPLTEADAMALGRLDTADTYDLAPDGGGLRGRRTVRLGAIRLRETPLPAPIGEKARAALISIVRTRGVDTLATAAPAIRRLQTRLALVADRINVAPDALSDENLLARADEWLAHLLGDPPSLSKAGPGEAVQSILTLIDWSAGEALARLAPPGVELPSGRRAPIDYAGEAGPSIEGRAQEFFGPAAHPSIADGATPLVATLLSPAGRPIATTRDLPGFWKGAYADMAKDMRARYPKHDWPDDPSTAKPHSGVTRARLGR